MSTVAELHHPVRPAPRLRLVPPLSNGSTTVGARVAPNTPQPLRLTRRGRLVLRLLGALTLGSIVAGGVLLLEPSAQAGQSGAPVPVSYHVVLPGETLWQIAGEVAPGVDRRDTVAELVELNALPNAAVSVGQRIAVPAEHP